MDVSVFESSGGEDSPSLSEVAAFFDEDLRLPVAGAVAIMRHLLRLVLLVWTLAACVFLYLFALAWLCLFWAQARLLKYTSAVLDCCMSPVASTTGAELKVQNSEECTQKVKVAKTSAHKGTIADISHFNLVAEAHSTSHLRECASPARSTTLAQETSATIEGDGDAIVQGILQREKELEAEIRQLPGLHGAEWDFDQSTTPSRVSSHAEGSELDLNYQAVSDVDENSTDAPLEQSHLSQAGPSADSLAGGTLAIDPSRQSTHSNQPNGILHVNSKPSVATTFKLTKTKISDKPRLNYAEQLKEKTALEQSCFVKSMTSNSILSPRKHDNKPRTTDAEHLKSVWNGENIVPPAHSRPLKVVVKASLSPVPSLLAARVPKGPKGQSNPETAKPVRLNDHSLLTGTLEQHITLPPHVKSALEVKARRAAADQLAYVATVKAKEAVSSDNPFDARSNGHPSVDAPNPPQVNDGEALHLAEDDTGSIPPPTAPSTPEPVDQAIPQDGTHSAEASDPSQPQQGEGQGDAAVDKRRVYTLEALKAIRNSSATTQEKPVAGRIEAAAELIAFHTRSGRASLSPKKKRGRGIWDNFDGTKEHPPVTDRIPTLLPAAEAVKTVPQVHGSSPVLRDRNDSALSNTFKSSFIEEAVETITEPALDSKVSSQATLSTSSNSDLAGLEFDVPASMGHPALKTIASKGSRALPITPGPLSFFAPSMVAMEEATKHHSFKTEWKSYQEPIAFNPFVPGPFQNNNTYHNMQTAQHFQPPQTQRTVSDGRGSQANFYGSQQKAPQMASLNPAAPNYACENTGMVQQRRQSLAVPIREPSSNLLSGEAFPALGAVKPMQTKISALGPPGLGCARSDTQATFDALLPTVDVTPERALNLGKFISTATTSLASLDRTHGRAVSEAESATTATGIPYSPPAVSLKEPPAPTRPPSDKYDATFPELPKPLITDTQVDGVRDDKTMKREKKKTARENLKDAWHDREAARKKLNGQFSLEGANDLKQKTVLYHGKRLALQSLMSSDALNQHDAKMFPEFGLMELSAPQLKVPGVEEWRSRKRESEAALPQVIDAAPKPSGTQLNDTDPIIKDMNTAQWHRERAMEQLKMPKPQGSMASSTWAKTCYQTCVRADKLYCRKRKILVAAYPAGLPKELEMRFPEISVRE